MSIQIRASFFDMLCETLSATDAGDRVGYDDTSHFDRNYKRFFGVPAMRDVERFRSAASDQMKNWNI